MNTDIEINADEEYSMPCAEALLAGTLALMTGHAQACCDGHREMIARKIAAQLAQLATHAQLSAEFQTMLWSLRSRWVVQAEQAQTLPATEQDRRLWHTTAPTLN